MFSALRLFAWASNNHRHSKKKQVSNKSPYYFLFFSLWNHKTLCFKIKSNTGQIEKQLREPLACSFHVACIYTSHAFYFFLKTVFRRWRAHCLETIPNNCHETQFFLLQFSMLENGQVELGHLLKTMWRSYQRGFIYLTKLLILSQILILFLFFCNIL